MKARIERFVEWRRARARARAIKSAMHVFTKLEMRLAKILRFCMMVLYPLTMRDGMFGYMGACSGCTSPANRFYIPILGRITGNNEQYPADRNWYIVRHTLVCPHCNQPFNAVGIFKSYNITQEINELRQRLADNGAEVGGGKL